MALQSQKSRKKPQNKYLVTGLTSRQNRLIYWFLLVSILPLVVVGGINFRQTRLALQQQSFEKLAGIRDLKTEQIESYIRDSAAGVSSLAQSPIIKQAVIDFSVKEYLPTIRQLGYGLDPEIIDSGQGTAYDKVHRRYHPMLRWLPRQWGYADMYLLTPDGDVIYSAKKSNDFATNLSTGIYRRSHLAQIFNDLRGSVDSSQIKMTDFVSYEPLNGERVSFVGAPVIQEGKVIGVFVFQLRLPRISELLLVDNEVIGQTGEVYMVGPDKLMRSNSRLSEETTAFIQRVDNEAVAGALDGYSGRISLIGYRGRPTVVAYRPVTVASQTWALLAEVSQAEILNPIDTLRTFALGRLALTVIAVIVASYFLARHFYQPVVSLTETVIATTADSFDITAGERSHDEISLLSQFFNTMTGRFREVINTLEYRVAQRTQQIETLVEISHQIVSILDFDELLRQVVILTKEKFNFYHVHIFLLDSDSETLTVAEGYGTVGEKMKRQGYSVALASPRSLVADCARERQTVITDDVSKAPYYLPNPLLPDTRAELAVPIIFGIEVIGVLDVQSEKEGGITETDRLTMESLANQVATAVRNARLLGKTQDALSDAQRLQRMYAGQSLPRLNETRQINDYEIKNPYLLPLDQITTLEVLTALQQKCTVTFGNMQQQEPAGPLAPQDFDDVPDIDKPEKTTYSVAATPLKLHDEIIGVLGLHDEDPNRVWTDDEIALIEAVSEQMSLAIENARLFERTQRDAWRNRVVSETTAQVWTSGEINAVMQAAVSQLAEKLQASEVSIQLRPDTNVTQENDHD